MTAATALHVSSPGVTVRATPFERTLLRTASAIDGFVIARLDERSSAAGRRALTAQSTSARARREAEARGAIGMIPR